MVGARFLLPFLILSLRRFSHDVGRTAVRGSSEVFLLEMNPYKLRALIDFIRREKGADINEVDDIVACFRLDRLLLPVELRRVKQELSAVLEAEAFMDRLSLSVLR